jgi:hypothetical protein
MYCDAKIQNFESKVLDHKPLIEVHHHNILKIERYIMNNKHDHSK